MTNEEFESIYKYETLLRRECSRVALKMYRVFNETYNSSYADFSADVPVDMNKDGVFCEVPNMYASHRCFIKKEWLFMSDEELDNMVDGIIKSEQEKYKVKEEERKAKQRENEIKEYYRLKEKLGL